MPKLNREILNLAIPNILSNISLPLLSTVDTAIMGHFSELHLGAIGLGGMIFNFLYWNFGFLRMSTTGFVAQSYGKHDKKGIIGHLARALIVGLGLAILILIVRKPLADLAFYLLNVTEAQGPLIAEYFSIRIWAAPASLCLYVLMGWFFGMQNARIPLVLTILINITNIGLSYYLAVVEGMAIAGVAYGTVIAQYVGLLGAIFFILFKYREYCYKFQKEAISKFHAYGRFFLVNRDIFLRAFFLTLAFGFFYSKSSAAGEMILAVNVILMQYLSWMSYGIDGFAYAAESIVGKYYGGGDKDITRKAIRYCFYWGGALAIFYAVVYGLGGRELLLIFTDEEAVIRAADKVLFWMFWMPLVGFACYIWDGIFIGLTASVLMRNTALLAFVLYIGTWFLTAETFPIHSLWISFIVFLGARGLFQTIAYIFYGLEMK